MQLKTKNNQREVNEFLRKMEKFRKGNELDLSSGEDLGIAVMNLVGLEEYFFFTAAKTGKKKYYDLLSKVREVRKQLLKKIVRDVEGEIWCISKHLLAASMRLVKVGTKYYKQGKKKEARDFFSKAYGLNSLFWSMNLKGAKASGVKKNSKKRDSKRKDDLTERLDTLVSDLINCCDE